MAVLQVRQALACLVCLCLSACGQSQAPVTDTDTVTLEWQTVETELMDIEIAVLPYASDDPKRSGGAIDVYGNAIVFVTVDGQIGLVEPGGGVIRYLGARVPMGTQALHADPIWQSRLINRSLFRVADILVTPTETGASQLYVNHHVYKDGKICARLSRTELSGESVNADILGNWETIYTAAPCVALDGPIPSFRDHMSGGQMLAGDDGRILMTVGDFGFGHSHPEMFEGGRNGDWGTLLSIDPQTGDKEIIATGLRAPQGLARDSEGLIWETEFGPQGADEINQINECGNYGWPSVSLGTGFALEGLTPAPLRGKGRDADMAGRHDEYDAPAMGFVPSVALRQMIFVPEAGDAFEPWASDALVLTLGWQTLFRLTTERSEITGKEAISLGHRMRDIVQLQGGQYAILTDNGKIVLLRDARDHTELPAVIAGYDAVFNSERKIAAQNASGLPRETVRYYCADCHSLSGDRGFGPPLNDIIGRDVADISDYPYSYALKAAGGFWSPERLADYLEDPETSGMSGTTMAPIKLTAQERADIVTYLAKPDETIK